MKPAVIVVPWLKARGMAIFPFILVRDEGSKADRVLINHEKIHLRQQLELFILPFYLLYLLLYLVNLLRYMNHYQAYRQIRFEREAFDHEDDLNYIQNRNFWAWMRA
ncbi:MAG: hypothetical protein REI78_06190 [Pedobacter sp.]|nr:hypothetical protein [Pedobacter sp.]MDQ8052594.1 hypothetical protein [Pedobacter sp.]